MDTEQDQGMTQTIEDACDVLRYRIQAVKTAVVDLLLNPELKEEDMMLSPGNIPPSKNGNIRANITLAFRHLEDARMRLGKVMQATQGGISKFDSK